MTDANGYYFFEDDTIGADLLIPNLNGWIFYFVRVIVGPTVNAAGVDIPGTRLDINSNAGSAVREGASPAT